MCKRPNSKQVLKRTSDAARNSLVGDSKINKMIAEDHTDDFNTNFLYDIIKLQRVKLVIYSVYE